MNLTKQPIIKLLQNTMGSTYRCIGYASDTNLSIKPVRLVVRAGGSPYRGMRRIWGGYPDKLGIHVSADAQFLLTGATPGKKAVSVKVSIRC